MLKVDTGCMEMQAQEMQRIANQLNDISSRVADVSRKLRDYASYADPIAHSLNMNWLALHAMEKKVTKLAAALQSGAAQYNQAEMLCKMSPILGVIDHNKILPPQISEPIPIPIPKVPVIDWDEVTDWDSVIDSVLDHVAIDVVEKNDPVIDPELIDKLKDAIVAGGAAITPELMDKLREVLKNAGSMDPVQMKEKLKEILSGAAKFKYNASEKALEWYNKAKEAGIEGVEWFWEKVTGYDLDTNTYETFVEDILFEALGLDDIDDIAGAADKFGNVVDDFKSGNISGETFSDMYGVITEGFKVAGDSPMSPVEIKVIGETLKVVDKYSAIVDGYEDAAVQAIKSGDYLAVPGYMGKSLMTLGKATVDVSANVIGNVFMLDEVGATLSMVTGHDIPGILNDWGTKISKGFDKLFNL